MDSSFRRAKDEVEEGCGRYTKPQHPSPSLFPGIGKDIVQCSLFQVYDVFGATFHLSRGYLRGPSGRSTITVIR